MSETLFFKPEDKILSGESLELVNKLFQNSIMQEYFSADDVFQIASTIHGDIIILENDNKGFPKIHRMDAEILQGLCTIEGFRWVEVDTADKTFTVGL